tara:strand:+ start:121 stop:723 length:603 start_codon:yes stop_codon:yes gene_type:complete
MRILIACEESQTIAKAFRDLGHDAFSCDLSECSGGYPEWHIQGDAIEIAYTQEWDMMIAHPPCTYLAVSGARWMYNDDGSRNEDREQKQVQALDFVQKLMDAPIEKTAIENPVSVISSKIRKPDQIIQPWMFGDEATKTTCLWLKNLSPLTPTDIVGKGEFYISPSGKKLPRWYSDNKNPKSRSKTFKGIANAIANQWSN